MAEVTVSVENSTGGDPWLSFVALFLRRSDGGITEWWIPNHGVDPMHCWRYDQESVYRTVADRWVSQDEQIAALRYSGSAPGSRVSD
jgi:hypothetical protein